MQLEMIKELYIQFPALGFGQEQRAAGQCQGNDLWLRSKKEQMLNNVCHTLLVHTIFNSLIKKCLFLLFTILQAKKQFLVL